MILLTQKLEEAQIDQMLKYMSSGSTVSIIIYIASYFLLAMALFTLAKKRGYGTAWLSFVPVANFYVLGGIVDHINSFNRKKSNSKISLLFLNGLSTLFTVLMASSIIKAFIEFGKSDDLGVEAFKSAAIVALIGAIIIFITRIALLIALHKVYSDYSSGKEVLLTLLTIFTGIYPLILFVIKNNASQTIYYSRQQALQEKEALEAQEALLARRHSNVNNAGNPQFSRTNQQNPQGNQVGRPMQVRSPQGNPVGQPMQGQRPQGNPQAQPMQQQRPQGNPVGQPMQQQRPQGNPIGQPMQGQRPQGNPVGQPMQGQRPQGNPVGQPMQGQRPQGNPVGQPMQQQNPQVQMPKKIQPLQPMQMLQDEDLGQGAQRNVYRTNRPLQQRPFVKQPAQQRPTPPMPPKERPEEADLDVTSVNPFQTEAFTTQMNNCDNECPPRTIYNAVKPIQSDRRIQDKPAPQMPTMQDIGEENSIPQMNSCDNQCPPRTIYNPVKPIQSDRHIQDKPSPQMPTMQILQNSEDEFDDEY